MNGCTTFISALTLAVLVAPAQGQETIQQTPEDDDPPVIVDDRPAPEEEEDDAQVHSEENALVQIEGAWASDEAACATTNSQGNGLYLTDTLIRWDEATCSIRDIDSEDGVADIYTECATGPERREQVFHLDVTGSDSMQLSFVDESGSVELELSQCPAEQ